MLSDLHALLADVAAAAAVVTLAAALIGVVVGARLRLWLDRVILVAVLALVVGAVSGLPLLATAGPPADALHLVYGLVGPVILLGGRYLGRSGSLRRRSLFVALASVALLGVMYRLFTTAGGG